MKVGHGDLLFVCDQGSLVGHRMQDHKCLCTAVMICTTLLFPKFDSSILIPLPSHSRSSSRDLLHPCQVFGVRLGCASGSAHTRLLTSLCVHRLPFVPPWLSQNVFVNCDPFNPQKQVKSQAAVAPPVRCTHGTNMVTAGQLLAEIMHILAFFYDALISQ